MDQTFIILENVKEQEHKLCAINGRGTGLNFVCLVGWFWIAMNSCPRHWITYSNIVQRPLKRIINTLYHSVFSVFMSVCLHWYFILTWTEMLFYSFLWEKDDILWMYWMRTENSEIMMSAQGKILKQLKFNFGSHPPPLFNTSFWFLLLQIWSPHTLFPQLNKNSHLVHTYLQSVLFSNFPFINMKTFLFYM